MADGTEGATSAPWAALLPVVAALTVWNLVHPAPAAVIVAGALTLLLIVRQWHRVVPQMRMLGLLLGALALLALPFSPTPGASLLRGIGIGILMASLVSAVSLLARVALRSRQIDVVTAYLLARGTRSRYLLFSIACQLFAGMLGLAGAQLMMSMAAQDDSAAPDDRLAMFLAITRGFSSATLWSPMFSNAAVLLVLYPGLTWFAMLPLGIALAAACVAIGQVLDRWRLRKRPAEPEADPGLPVWGALATLLVPMSAFLAAVIGLSWALGMQITGAVIALSPAAALALHFVLAPRGDRRQAWRRFAADVRQLPAQASEITLFMAAGCGGTVLASAIPPAWAAAAGTVLAVHPLLALLALMLCVLALALIGVHPVLSAVLVASAFPPALVHLPLLPHLCAVLVGWALAGAVSPFSIANLMASRYAGVSVQAISLRANSLFSLLCLALAVAVLGGVAAALSQP